MRIVAYLSGNLIIFFVEMRLTKNNETGFLKLLKK